MVVDNQIDLGHCWLPYRQLNNLIKNSIRDGSLQACSKLESALIKHKADFISAMKNAPKNSLHREVVRNACNDGITIIENQNKLKKVIPQDMVNEALLLSDLFNLNELNALELLITGQNQLSRFPDMSRGTVAVLYYYDSKKNLLSALQTLIQVSSGRSWTSKLSKEISRCINRFVNELKEESIVIRCCNILNEFDIKREYDMLETNRGLGPYRYRKQVFDTMKDIRKITANIIFNYSAQTYLSTKEMFSIFELVQNKSCLESTYLDTVTTELLLSMLYALDVSFIQELEDDEQRQSATIDACWWIKNGNAFAEFVSKLDESEFVIKSIKPIIRLAVSLNLKTLSMYSLPGLDLVEIDEEKLIDRAIEENVFENINQLLAQNKHLYSEEFFVHKIHSIICDMIMNMSHKIKELRDKADESGIILNALSAESIKPFTNLSQASLQFDKFLRFLATFYHADPYGLSNDFWLNVDQQQIHSKSVLSRQQVLHKFVRSLHESFFPQLLHAAVIKFFRSLARHSPFNVFNLIKNTSFHTSIQFSISSFSETLNDYLNTVRGSDNTERISASFSLSVGFNNHIHQHVQNQGNRRKLATTADVESICAIVNLLEEIVQNDRTCCVAIAENQQYLFIPIMVSILRCAVSRELKAQILKCFAAFSTVSSVSNIIWREIETILPRYNQSGMLSHPKLWQNGIAIEIEEIEVKNEEYPITIAFLELMNTLFSHLESRMTIHQMSSSESCFKFIIDSILLKTSYRIFKNENEKWIVMKLAYQLLLNIVQRCDFIEGLTPRMLAVFSQILQENLLFRHIISSLEESVTYLEVNYNQPTLKDYDHGPQQTCRFVEQCTVTILSLLREVCQRQDLFFESIRGAAGLCLSTFVKFDSLFNNINPRTNRQDRLVILFRMLPFSSEIAIHTLRLLRSLCDANFEMTYLCLMQCCSNVQNPLLKSEQFNQMFVECLERDSQELRKETLLFIDTYLGQGSATSKYTFAHKLIGIESKLFSLKNVSLFCQSYTCLHSILSLFDGSIIEWQDLLEERKLGMHIIYKLCSSVHTNEIVLRVLRSSYEFNLQYLKFWNRLTVTQFAMDQKLVESLLFEITYFLKILAIDIRITSEQKLQSYCSSYVSFLFKETKKPRILGFLYPFVFEHDHPTMQSFDYFDSKELQKTILESLNVDKTIDLPLLHQKLFNEIRALGTQIGLSSSSLLREEIKKIMLYCTSVNQSIEMVKQKSEFIESWCELVQVIILCSCLAGSGMEQEMQSRYLAEINLELINRIMDPSTNDHFYRSISSTILIASWALNEIDSKSVTNISSCIRSIMHVLENSSLIWSKQKRARINFYASLLYLFRLLPPLLFKELRFSSNLLDKFTRDILAGHEVAKMLAISILNRCDCTNWLNELILNGSLKQLLLSLLSDEREIRANKYEFIKAFYVFESKMMLLLIIFSSTNVDYLLNGLLNNLDLVQTLESLQCFDMYPYLICENPVCFKMFVYILRLMITITTISNNRQIISEFGSFISAHSILHDLIRLAPTIKESVNGSELLLLVSRLIGRLVLNVNRTLQTNFIGLLPLFCSGEQSLASTDGQIVFIILNACVQLVSSNATDQPLFEPSLSYTDSRLYCKHNLGLLVSIIHRCTTRSNDLAESIAIIESALYLLWTHFNMYFSMSTTTADLSLELMQDIDLLRSQAESTFNEVFFAKIQSVSGANNNVFIDALSRRIKRIVYLKHTHSFSLTSIANDSTCPKSQIFLRN
ncbi:nuclear pore complex protein Nup205 isoform X1 [Dermatophagoides farinae]|uniref:Nuclear pore complex protein nup205-like n=1 Tax=Dermatophagoides farinae TaxID=6954 RepID=A0A922HX31_DERFA|nr:nuclear pore complex protein Nup205-like isoform X1 [Dermatophagoides farinae]KAH7645888.1 nuclear pore complex protein nup205-like [Dermatophagoides farinae]KAH9516126.1 hypothetical protein DERF_006888 [Dermatophagoides farinae]